MRSFCTKELFPVVHHILLHQLLKIFLRKGGLKLMLSFWKTVLMAELLDVVEPRFSLWSFRTEHIHSNLMRGVFLESTDHSKYS